MERGSVEGVTDVSAPALVLVHGFALDARMWRRQVEAFRADHRILLVDLPGFGPQARELGEVRPASELARAIDAAKLERVHLVACSYGAAVAIDYALAHPERVRSLVLVAPMLLGRRMGIDSWQRCVALASEGDRLTAAEIWLDDPIFSTLRQQDGLFEEVRQIVLDYSGAHWTGKVSSVWAEPDPVPRLRSLAVPTLIVSGERDLPSFKLMAETYVRMIPGARHEIIQRAGHHASLEAPDTFNALVRVFLSGSA